MTADATVTLIDVGQGNCALVADLVAGSAAVVDCPEGKAHLVLAHLQEQRVSLLQTVVATHNDLDHLGGIYEVAEQGAAREVRFNHGTVVPEATNQAIKLTAALRALAGLNDRGVQLAGVHTGESGRVGAIKWHALAPDHALISLAQSRRRPNDASMVLRFSVHGRRFLLTGDAGDATWLRVLQRGSDLRADVMLVPHHGADLREEGLLAKVLDASEARFFIISVGTRNRFGHPAERVLQELSERSGRLMCTQVNAHCLGGAELPRAEALRLPSTARIGAGLSSSGACPCAGSIRFIVSAGSMTVTPSEQEHGRVTTAMNCPYSS